MELLQQHDKTGDLFVLIFSKLQTDIEWIQNQYKAIKKDTKLTQKHTTKAQNIYIKKIFKRIIQKIQRNWNSKTKSWACLFWSKSDILWSAERGKWAASRVSGRLRRLGRGIERGGIPHICHYFCKISHFVKSHTQSTFFQEPCEKFYTWLKTFTQPAVVMVVTNMRCAAKLSSKEEDESVVSTPARLYYNL